ncbi:hypothetical protein VTN00DRAFT_4516 [Thermoascus crustaceus]|uniref:uncharacterized protein n=1 Tax=Thermoascus crustaceus TaxID=5088 RepID=UPI00374421A8
MRLLSHRPVSSSSSFSLRSHTVHVLLVFLFLYLLLVQYARMRCFRDPTSLFFDPNRGYRPAYSTVRAEQANAFIDKANSDAAAHKLPQGSHKVAEEKKLEHEKSPGLCVGVASIAREGARYFKTTVGTVLADLSETERADIHLILFIAHTDPTRHPAYSERWLHELADTVLLYDPDEVDIEHIRGLETDQHAKVSGREKGLFDYAYLLKACYAVNASYVVMLEDDIVALDEWYHRTRDALRIAERQTAAMGASKWLYLRLFYTEEFLGWNIEEWPIYLFCSLIVIATLAVLLLGTRHYLLIPSTTTRRRFLTNETIFLLCGVCTPLLIALFFAAGRVTMLPIPPGVHDMPRFGCCSQGLVFPRSRVPDLLAWYESRRIGYVDMLTEEYADLNGEIRWALTPSVLQHVGRKSSKADDYTTRPKYHLSVAERLWNFAFETNDAKAARWGLFSEVLVLYIMFELSI